MKYIDADKIRAEIERHLERATAEQEKFPDMPKYRWYLREGKKELCNDLLDYMYDTLGVEEPITDSLQQEQTPDTDAFHTELVNLLKTYRIGEETARTMADRIADTYGVQRYMDGLCDGLNEEDTKQEQPEVDLEKEVGDFWDIVYGKDRRCTRSINIYDFQSFARHFYELRNRELEEAARRVYESWMGGTMDDVRRDMVELGRVINARKV